MIRFPFCFRPTVAIGFAMLCSVTVYQSQAIAVEPVLLRGHADAVYDIEFSPHGEQLATASYDNSIKIWDLDDGSVDLNLLGHTDQVFRITNSPSGSKLVSCSSDGTAIEWDLQSGETACVLRDPGNPILDADYFPDGKTLVTVGGTIRLWIGSESAWSSPNPDLYFSVAVAPDGESFCAGTKSEIHVFDRASGTPTKKIEAGAGMVYNVAYSPDGSTVASVCSDGFLTLWDATSFERIATVQADQFSLFALRFRSDGATILTAGRERVIRAWSTADLRLQSEQRGPEETVLSVDQSPNGAMMACGSYDGMIHLWKQTP